MFVFFSILYYSGNYIFYYYIFISFSVTFYNQFKNLFLEIVNNQSKITGLNHELISESQCIAIKRGRIINESNCCWINTCISIDNMCLKA